nr:transposase [Membranihabitans maritimus]
MIAVLHTWGQNLSLHPHLHCIVPAGGVSQSGNWKHSKYNRKFLFSVKALSKMFRAKLVHLLRQSPLLINPCTYDTLFSKNWVVYAKKPFGKPEHVIEYLGRYSHKVAISNHRIIQVNKHKNRVKFSAKNYRNGAQKISIDLSMLDFIKKFQLHILPKGFTRIRHYGCLSSSWKKTKLPRIQAQLYGKPLPSIHKKSTQQPTNLLRKCPKCKKGTLITIAEFSGRAPPKSLIVYIRSQYPYS